jgi:L-seryl-tRNA(Ser) seleniumtransferase
VAKFADAAGSVPLAQIVALAQEQGVPVIVDAADELPPLSNARRLLEIGADLVVFSGGKDIRGPQASGLILGKKGLVDTCAFHNCPNYGTGRPMKVSKETIAGLARAVELYVEQDFEAEWKAWEAQRDYLVQRLLGLTGVRASGTRPVSPGAPASAYLPAAYVALDEAELGMTIETVIQQLREGNPGIVVGRSQGGIVLRVQMMQQGEEQVVAARLLEILEQAGRTYEVG